jgi:hypothetical protein
MSRICWLAIIIFMLAYGIIIYRQAEPYFTGCQTEMVPMLPSWYNYNSSNFYIVQTKVITSYNLVCSSRVRASPL